MILTRILLWTMVGSLLAAAGLGLVAVIFPTTWQTNEKVFITLLLAGAFCLPVFACAMVLRKRRLAPLMWTSVVSLTVALVLWLVLVWVHVPWEAEKWVVCPAVVANTIGAWGAHVGLLSLVVLTGRLARLVRHFTLGFAGVLAALVILAVASEPESDLYFQGLLVLIIFTVCGTFITPVLGVIEMVQAHSNHGSVPLQVKVDLTCPRCGSAERVSTGRAKCSKCGLRIVLELEEPRCSCGYLLYQLHGDACPECGRVIPAEDRWAADATEATPEAAECEQAAALQSDEPAAT